MRRSLASEASLLQGNAAAQLAPALSPYARSLGRKVGISQLSRAAIHLRQYEILSSCVGGLREAAMQHGQERRHELLLRLREDVISPLPVPAVAIVEMLRTATRRGVGAIVTSDLESNGGLNDKGAFLNAAASRDYFHAPLEELQALRRATHSALPHTPCAFPRRTAGPAHRVWHTGAA